MELDLTDKSPLSAATAFDGAVNDPSCGLENQHTHGQACRIVCTVLPMLGVEASSRGRIFECTTRTVAVPARMCAATICFGVRWRNALGTKRVGSTSSCGRGSEMRPTGPWALRHEEIHLASYGVCPCRHPVQRSPTSLIVIIKLVFSLNIHISYTGVGYVCHFDGFASG